MKRPLLWILVFYILGIILGQYKVLEAMIALFFTIILTVFIYNKYKWYIIFLFPLIVVLGYINFYFKAIDVDKSMETLINNNKNLNIYGIVKDISYTKTGRQKLILAVKSLSVDNLKLNKKFKIQIILDLAENLEYNQEAYLNGTLEHFDFARNPGAFNENSYMKSKKIEYKMFAHIIKKGKIIKNFEFYLNKIHLNLALVYDTILPKKEASTLKAMILGDKAELDNSIKEVYRKAGISHILAISGLHISIFASILLSIFNIFELNKRISASLLLILLSLYCIFTGNSISTLRAVIMIAIGLIGDIIYRKSDIYTSIGFAAFLLLLYQPLYLYDVGFQLSFTALIGIIIVTPIMDKVNFIPKSIKVYLLPTLSATLFTIPVIAYHFNSVSFIGILINIIILPFVSVLVIFGIISGIIGMIWIQAGKFICGIVYFILQFYERVCILGYNIIPEFITGEPSLILIFSYYTIILLISYYFYTVKSKRQYLKRYLKLIMFSLSLINLIIASNQPKLEIVFLDVSQGDSIAIHTRTKNILIDGGGYINRNLDEPNIGSQIILPYLKYKGIKLLDAVFITHYDGDHILGIIELIDFIKINKLIVSDDIDNNELFKALQAKASKYSIPIVKMNEGDLINLENNLVIKCIYPNYDDLVNSTNNNKSLVLDLEYQASNLIFTGDIEKEAEQKIIQNYKFECDIIKVPHHGSKTSSTSKFVKCLNPKIAIISAGRKNLYGHPNKEVLDQYKSIGSKIYNTAVEGAISIYYNPHPNISTMREKENERTKKAN